MSPGLANGWARSRRLGAFAAACTLATLDHPGVDARDRAAWIQRHSRRFSRAVGMEVRVTGDPSDAQAWVGNHLGYLDILGLASVGPVAFVAKAEVARWPLLGRLATQGGTIYVDRTRRMAVGEVVGHIRQRATTGVPVVFFPEGTSTNGHGVLPFHAPLFEPLVDLGLKVAPFAIRMESSAGVEPAYWGDMTFGPHFLSLLGQIGRAHV